MSMMEFLKIIAENICAFHAGATLAFTSSFLPKVVSACFDHYTLHKQLSMWECIQMVEYMPLGAILGTLLAGVLIHPIGRKLTCLLVAVIPPIIGYAVMAINEHLYITFGGRFLIGIGVGATFLILPLYNAEICSWYKPTDVFIMFYIFFTAGMCFCYIVNGYFSAEIFCISSGAIGIVAFLFVLILLSDPYFHLKRGNQPKAESIMTKLKNTPDIDREIFQAKETMKYARESSFLKDLRDNKCDKNALKSAVVFMAFLQFGGGMTVIVYGQWLLDNMDSDPFDRYASWDYMVYLGVVVFIVTLLIFRIFPFTDRRTILSISLLIMAISVFILAFSFFDTALKLQFFTNMHWLVILFYIAFVTFFIATCITCWTVIAEIFSRESLPKALVLVLIIFWLFYILMTAVTFFLMDYQFALGVWFLICTIICILALYFVQYVLMETRGKSYSEVKELLNNLEFKKTNK